MKVSWLYHIALLGLLESPCSRKLAGLHPSGG
jgi:hypothetical protein